MFLEILQSMIHTDCQQFMTSNNWVQSYHYISRSGGCLMSFPGLKKLLTGMNVLYMARDGQNVGCLLNAMSSINIPLISYMSDICIQLIA